MESSITFPKGARQGEPAWIQAFLHRKFNCSPTSQSFNIIHCCKECNPFRQRPYNFSCWIPYHYWLHWCQHEKYPWTELHQVNFEQRTWWCNNKKTEKSITQGQNSHVLILSNYYIFSEYNDMVLINFFVKSTINMKE